MIEKFIVPKEPRLHWKMLLPNFGNDEFFPALNGRPIHYVFWARNAIYHGLAALGIRAGENVLVPSFHCTSVVEPILKYGGEVKFYNVGLNLKPDFTDIKSKIDGKTRAILAVHYFGFPQPIRQFRELCQEHGLYLIEDCAHVLAGRSSEGTALGDYGDISIFSWRKFLPLYDGGQLVINNPKVTVKVDWEKANAFFSLKVAKNTLDKLIVDSSLGQLGWPAAFWTLPSSFIRRWLSLHSHIASAVKLNSFDLEFDPASANLRMSSLSRRILRHTKITDVVEKRRTNYKRVCAEIRNMAGIAPVYPNLPENTCPWVFPLLVHEVKDLHLVLRERGIPATTWSGVIHASLPLEQFPNAQFLYENLVFLPIHQSMDKCDLAAMTDIIGEILRDKVVARAKNSNDRFSLPAVSRW
jgi:perosamine synthetase